MNRNVAEVARAPKQRGTQRVEGTAWTDSELRAFLRAAAGHRYFPILWLAANTGMRRNELIGLKWTDIDFTRQRLALNRGLVAVGYEVHETRGKTKTARRNIALDLVNDTTVVDVCFNRIVRRSNVPRVRFHDLRHTHASLLIADGVPIKVVSERLGHAHPSFTMHTYQHLLPGMSSAAAERFATLVADASR